ncbi:hypothetical protein pdam_00013663 [Pocillopora damicornis]|uniref:Fibrinogen C-terminal domain-containing protein n=1 Tax=Pocillopora damicornis TaxID=46731 RepID=A0A3M6UKM0_POCDA|nr:hypothetical protein pdam_00013663 [Pocillopora damicornis]
MVQNKKTNKQTNKKTVFPAVQLQNCSQAPKKTGIYNILNHGSGPFPVYCDQTTDGGGWMMIFKVIGGINSSFSAGEFWNSSDTFSENVTAALDTTSSYRGNYKNLIVQSWQMFSPKEARVALYTNGTEVVSIIFSAKGNYNMNSF